MLTFKSTKCFQFEDVVVTRVLENRPYWFYLVQGITETANEQNNDL